VIERCVKAACHTSIAAGANNFWRKAAFLTTLDSSEVKNDCNAVRSATDQTDADATDAEDIVEELDILLYHK